MTTPGVTVVIRNRNEGRALRRVLLALSRQTLPFELVIVDNESTDGSASLYAEYGARVVNISAAEFTYGRALNLGIAAASSELVLLLSAHSIPIGRTFLEDCVRSFSDPGVAAVMCLEVDRATEWLEECRLVGPISCADILSANIGNRAAAIRRDVWSKYPYDEEIEAAEDLLWCLRVINDGGYAVVRGAALFQYVSKPTLGQQVRRENRERVAIYRICGTILNADLSLGRLIWFLAGAIPRRAVVSVIRECARFLSVRRTVRQSRQKSLAGSVR
jgi:glycosyltransferase involved in cell wall biosynthesis